MFCRNCGVPEGLNGAPPELNHATWLCPECSLQPTVGYHFNPATGAVNDSGALPYWKRVQAMIQEEVRVAVYPPPVEGVVNTRRYRRVEQRESDGSIWRGMLYLVDPTLPEVAANAIPSADSLTTIEPPSEGIL